MKGTPVTDSRRIAKLHRRVDEYGRVDVARLTGIPYGSLSNKIKGFTAITEEEFASIEEVLPHA